VYSVFNDRFSSTRLTINEGFLLFSFSRGKKRLNGEQAVAALHSGIASASETNHPSSSPAGVLYMKVT
jgi:hypothetical protein